MQILVVYNSEALYQEQTVGFIGQTDVNELVSYIFLSTSPLCRSFPQALAVRKPIGCQKERHGNDRGKKGDLNEKGASEELRGVLSKRERWQ